MPQMERVDNLIIGSGESGKWLAWELGKADVSRGKMERSVLL
jgi:hypothetical protein